jgi:chromosome segregation ATPase
LQQSFNAVKEENASLTLKLQTHMREIDVKDDENKRTTFKMSTINDLNCTLQRDLQEARIQVTELTSKVNEDCDEGVETQNHKNNLEVKLVDVTAQYEASQTETKKLTSELSHVKRELTEIQIKFTETSKVNERMKSLLDNLEQTKDELLNRLQSSNTDKRSSENEKAVLLNDMGAVQRDLMLKD